MQDHYFKYVCTDGKTVFFALHKSDLESERNNDINLYFEKCKKTIQISKNQILNKSTR